jgi:excisionase family DNA binding protein
MSTHEMTEQAPDRLLSVSSAARLLGVSASSLRAWAAAGQVPHRRTRGGHRRFDRRELDSWLADRGGSLPDTQTRPIELLPTRVEPMGELGRGLLAAAGSIVDRAEGRLAARAGGSRRRSEARQARLADQVALLAEALERGDMSAPYREAEWTGFRHGAAGLSVDGPLAEALALRFGVEGALAEPLRSRPERERRALARALDRVAVRVVDGFAEGVRSRRRSDDD